jgi:PAS domain S-box-containing protein
VFDNTYQFIGFLDPDGTVLEANDAALSFGDVDREEVVGKPLWETTWVQANEEAQETAKRAVEQAGNGEMFRDEVRMQGDDREAIIDFTVRPVTNEQGEVTSLIPEGHDITERRERERKLAESEARYRALAENFPNGGVFLFDEDLRYRIVSGSGFAPIDTDPEDLVGNTIYQVETHSEGTVETLKPIMESTVAGNKETVELTYENHVYTLQTAPIRDDEGEVIGGLYITQDITEQRERETELQRQNERLEEFASVASHDPEAR